MKKTFLLLLLFFCQLAGKAQDSKPFVLGMIDELQSKELNEKRVLNIYLPEGYQQKDSIKYPVIYLLDGSADEDFIHVVGLAQFDNFEWVNRLPKSIIVGIATVDRRRDLTTPLFLEEDKKRWPTAGHSEKFMNFIEKELQPYINGKFKTNSDRMLIGESLGGLFATEVLFKRPRLFNRYIIVSPSLWWNDGELLKLTPEILNENYDLKTSIYVGVGKEGLTPGKDGHVQEVDANILADKIKNSKSKNIHVVFDYLPDESHATIGHHAIFNAFRMLFEEK